MNLLHIHFFSAIIKSIHYKQQSNLHTYLPKAISVWKMHVYKYETSKDIWDWYYKRIQDQQIWLQLIKQLNYI